MSDWNPSLYLHFAAERSRPAVELLARVPLENIEYIADLGCGPGNITALLHQRWPAARITGIDSSPAMIAEARSALPDCLFVEADIRNWQPEQALDLIFANASLQWLPDHYELFPHLVSLLNSHGVLAIPPYGVIITSAGNGDREEFSLEFLLHHSSVTGQFQ